MYFTNYRPFANHYYERNNIGFCLFRNLFSLSFPICSQIYYFCKLIINRLSTIWSHPLWVRGLKRCSGKRCVRHLTSHPLWVRGLKHTSILASRWSEHVAPLVGAWIETSSPRSDCHGRSVAPLVGAWIETTCGFAHVLPCLRRTPCGCVD